MGVKGPFWNITWIWTRLNSRNKSKMIIKFENNARNCKSQKFKKKLYKFSTSLVFLRNNSSDEINYVMQIFLSANVIEHCNPVQGEYRARTGFSLCSKFSQGKTCFHFRESLFSLQGPCILYRDFPVRITMCPHINSVNRGMPVFIGTKFSRTNWCQSFWTIIILLFHSVQPATVLKEEP